MAHYHSHTRIIGRSAGRSAVAAAAYRAGEKIKNDYEQCISDFSRRGGVIHTEIMAPEGASPWVYSREQLWNRVEATETRKDAQLAREVELALPHELDDRHRLDLVRSYVQQQFVNRGMVADVAIHKGHTDERNIHAHVMLTMRKLLPDGFGPKVTEWNDYRNVKHWRREWAGHQNRAYRDAGLAHRVDDRSYHDRGIDRRPTIHEGPKGRRMRQRGYQPRSKAVQRRTWNGHAQRPVDYRRIDLGRTRHQRNQQIAWSNRARQQSGRLSRLVEAHIHRFHFENTWHKARDTGQQLRKARKDGRRAFWLAERAGQIVKLHRDRLRDLLFLDNRLPSHSSALSDLIFYRSVKLLQARSRLHRRRNQARQAKRLMRSLETRYRNLKSRLADRQRQHARAQLAQRHMAALRSVSNRDIWASGLTERQKQKLVHERARLRQRERDRTPDIADILDSGR